MILKHLTTLALLLSLVGCFWDDEKDPVKPERVNILVPITVSIDFYSCYGGLLLKDASRNQTIYYPEISNCSDTLFSECRHQFKGKIKTKFGYPLPTVFTAPYNGEYMKFDLDSQGIFYFWRINTYWNSDFIPTYKLEIWERSVLSENIKLADTLYIYTFNQVDSATFLKKTQVDSLFKTQSQSASDNSYNAIHFLNGNDYGSNEVKPNFNPNCPNIKL